MKNKLGLDFGMTTSILSYMRHEELRSFSYGGETGEGTSYVPTTILYDEDDIHIGTPAIEFENENLSSERYFKMRLPISETEGISAEDLTADFIGELIKGTCPRRERDFPGTLNDLAFVPFLSAEVEKLVIAIPYTWERSAQSLGRQRLQRALNEQIQLPVVEFVFEPVAAAAYYSYKYKKNKDKFFKGNLLVCDMGGGTFDVTLCRVSAGIVTPIAKAGSDRVDRFGIAGNHFDRTLIKNCFNDIDELNLVALMLDLDRQKKAKTKQLNQALSREKSRDFTTIYVLNYEDKNVNVKVKDLEKAFSEIDASIGEILQKVIGDTQKQGESIEKVILVGGFSRFPLVKKSIRHALDKNGLDSDKLLDLNTLNTDEIAYAISYGACLIANEIIETSPKYPHNICLMTTNWAGEDSVIELIKADTALSKLAEFTFLTDEKGHKLPFIVKRPNIEIEFTIELNKDGKPFKEKGRFKLPKEIDFTNRHLFVGGRVDERAHPYLILQLDQGARESFEYSLENIIAK